MANVTEMRFLEVAPQALLVDGDTNGKVAVLAACRLFKVGQIVYLKSSTEPPFKVKIKRFISDTEFYVGAVDKPIQDRVSTAAYLVADSATVNALEQARPAFKSPTEPIRYAYAEEPAMALRNLLVDEGGDPIGSNADNPLHTRLSDGSVNIGTVEANIEVHTTHLDNSPTSGRVHDSIRIGDGIRESTLTDYGGSKNVIDTAPFELSVIRGKVPEFTIVKAFGINDNVGVANAEDIWAEGGIYEFPTTAQQISVESDNAADDGIGGGSGGRTLEINGLDENFEEISETITLNGITPVLTTQEFLRVQNARVITAGGSGRNEGIIRGSHGGTILFHIPSEKNNSFLGIFTIPANKTGYLKKFYAGCVAAQKAAGVKEGRIHLLATDQAEGSVFRHVFCFDISSRATTPFYIPIDFYEPFTEKTDLQIRFIAFSNNTEVASGMHIMLESIV